jgi:hypothetical protein
MSQSQFTLGKPASEFLAVSVLRRGAPDATDYSDGNWLVGNVTLNVGGFSGSYEADFRTTDFPKFKGQLRELYHTLDGEASLITDEEQLRITISGDRLGHFEARCAAQDKAGTGNLLTFTLYFDQTEIPAILQQLEHIVHHYPVRGAPAA